MSGSNQNRRQVIGLGLALTLVLSGLAAVALTNKRLAAFAGSETSVRRDHQSEQPRARAAASPVVRQLEPQAGGQFDVVRDLVAGGGGTSNGGTFEVNGSAGQPAAGTEMKGGQFSLTSGYWQPEFIPAATPTPQPTATPTPQPTATPTPQPTATPTPQPTATPTPQPTATPTPEPTATPTPAPTATPTPVPNVVQFSPVAYSVQEECTTITITVNRIGDTSSAATVDYFTSDVTASERNDYITALGTLQFAPGQTTQSLVVLINEDSYVEGNETFTVNLANPVGVNLGASTATVTIVDDATEPAMNALDDPRTFVCQQYHDFLNRQPDQGGWDFWTNQITSCGSNQACIETARVNVSAAFFLSIEFQNTGYLVERLYKTAFGDGTESSTFGGAHNLPVPVVRLRQFLSDTQHIGDGVVVLQPGWGQKLEANKQAYVREFVQRSAFTGPLPTSMTPAQFVDTLNQNAEAGLSANGREALIDLFGGAADSHDMDARAQVLRAIAEDQGLYQREYNRAFVWMQYSGYLRRNPNDPQDVDYTGYDFWLTKLNQFDGNYINAEMVKAFLSSIEYRKRFGP